MRDMCRWHVEARRRDRFRKEDHLSRNLIALQPVPRICFGVRMGSEGRAAIASLSAVRTAAGSATVMPNCLRSN
jgi:hypothetical protein